MRERVDAGRRGHPRADTVAEERTDSNRSVRNLLAAAKRDLAWGNQQAAADKMEVCLTMVDPANRDCAALREKALGR
jgi:hypothetical protein